MLNTREMATLCWAAIVAAAALVWLLASPSGRQTARSLLGTLLDCRILLMFATSGAWTALVVLVAARTCLWTPDMLGSTLLLGIPTAVALAFKALQAAEGGTAYARNYLLRAVEASVFVQILADVHSFSLRVEMALLLVLTLAVLVQESVRHQGQPRAASCCGVLLALASLTMVGTALWWLAHHPNSLGHLWRPALMTFWLPLAVLPYVLLLALAMAYGSAFTKVQVSVGGDRRLPWRTRLGILSAYRFGIADLHRLNSPGQHRNRQALAHSNGYRHSLQIARQIRTEDTKAPALPRSKHRRTRRGSERW